MACWIVKLKFNAPLHLGKSGIGMENVEQYARSDTMFSALCYVWASLFGNESVSSLLEEFKAGNPPFIISSTFPYNKETFFLPKPLVPAMVDKKQQENVTYLKELNKLEFLDLQNFINWVRGKTIPPEQLEDIKTVYQGASIYHLVPRVQLDRVSNASGLFHSGMTVFAPEARLYCLIKVNDNEILNNLQAVFEYLGQNGIGGMRSVGMGTFEPQWIKAEGQWLDLLSDNTNAPAYCLLSLFRPAAEEQNNLLTKGYYEVIERRGWSASPFSVGQIKRKSCRMLVEGTVLPVKPIGCLVDVTSQKWKNKLHPIYRYGYAFAVPMEVPVQ